MALSSSIDAGGAGTGLLVPPAAEISPRRRRRKRAGGPPQPPSGPEDGGRGGGGDGDDEDEPAERPGDALALGPSELGLSIVLLAITLLFVVFVAAYFMLRRGSEAWPPEGFRGTPNGLWASTALLVASSVALTRTSRTDIGARRAAARRWVGIALLLGCGFVAAQAYVWRELWSAGTEISSNAWGTAFYTFSFLHALHVVAGLGYLARVRWLARAERGAWTLPLKLGSLYWHFMGGVWIALFAVLYLST